MQAEETPFEKTLRSAIATSGKSRYALAAEAKVNERGLGKFLEGTAIRSDTAGRVMAVLGLEIRKAKKHRE